jgi:HlyD family secretion protein
MALAPVLALLAGCGGDAGARDGGDASVERSHGLRRGEFRRTLLITGELDAVTGHPVIVPRLPSWRVPIRWLVDDGARVSEGERVAALDSSQIASDLDNKRVARDGALNELSAKEAEISGQLAEKIHAVEKARIAFRRAEIAAEVPEDIQPHRDWQEKQLALERSTTALEKARADLAAYRESSTAEIRVQEVAVAKAKRELAEAERAMEAMVLRAPREGVVVVNENRREGRKFQIGDDAWVGLELLRIPELDRMMVRADLSDVDDGLIHPGQRAMCTLDTYPDREFDCVVRSVRPVAQEAGWRSERRSFAVELDVGESDPSIMRPGMSVKVEVEVDRREDVLLADRSSLQFRPDGEVVLDQGVAGDRLVRLGDCNELDCVVLDDDDGAAAAGAGS